MQAQPRVKVVEEESTLEGRSSVSLGLLCHWAQLGSGACPQGCGWVRCLKATTEQMWHEVALTVWLCQQRCLMGTVPQGAESGRW